MGNAFNVLSRLVRNENTATEALCGLLQFKAIRDIFFELFLDPSLNSDSPAVWNIDTQESLGEHGRPDLVVRGPGVIILIEVKIERGTVPTDNQPEQYLNWLYKQKAGDQRYFVLLAPERYAYKNHFEEKFRPISDGVKNAIITWEGFIARLEEHDMQGLNAYVSDFLDILMGWLYPPSLKMDIKEVEAMFGSDTAKGMKNLIMIVDRVIDDLKMHNISVRESKTKSWCGEYGCYVNDGDSKTMLWFGVWVEYWEKKGIPLCYGVEIDRPGWLQESVSSVQNISGGHLFTDSKGKQWYLIDISKETFGEKDPPGKIVEELRGLVEKCKKK